MDYLSDQDINFISKEISNSAIESPDLKEDLIDHFCCVIESEMKNDKGFNEAYKIAFKNICPNGFDEIQKETVFLLTQKKIRIMKKLIYLLGFLSLFSLTSGFLFKFLHWPGANVFLLLSIVVFSLAVLPLFFINQYKKEISKVFSNKLKYILGCLGFSMLLIAVFFKLNHWPGANILILVSVLILNFGFFPLLFLKMYKKAA